MLDFHASTVRLDDGAQLCVQTLGDHTDPALLLIGGATWWEDELCRRLADRGRMIIRYDTRDTGRSTHYPVGAPGYTSTDLTTDAVTILDSLGMDRAHLVGLSMGGGIAQRLALGHRSRVASLTLIATSLESERPYAGPGNFQEAALRVLSRVVERSPDMAASMTNHFLISDDDPAEAPLSTLRGLPTLVLHGAADPLFPPAHGQALADAIPGARLIVLPGMGHQLPPHDTWDLVVEELIRHTAG